MATVQPIETREPANAAQPAETGNVINGVDVDALAANIEVIGSEPSLAAFQFRLANRWIDGGHNRSVIKSFHAVGEEDTERVEPFILDADEPPVLLGRDTGANPVEHLLHALTSCLTTSIIYHGAARGIEVRELTTEVEGDIDVRGFLGLSEDVPKGYKEIRVKFRVDSDGDEKTLRTCASFSPVYSVVSGALPVKLEFETI